MDEKQKYLEMWQEAIRKAYDAMKNGDTEMSDKFIQEMEDGTQYFCIHNPYSKKSLADKIFLGRIADAVKTIMEDYADVLLGGSGTNVFNKGTYPIILIDREKGEAYREKFKEGWKNSEFGWGIEYGSKNSFGGYHLIDEKGDYCSFSCNSVKVYDTKEEADNALEAYHKEAETLAKQYIEKYEDTEFIKNVINHNSGFVEAMFFDMIKDDVEGSAPHLVEDTYNLENIGWRVVQVVKSKEKDNA